mmetsp:Transcript_24209/g.53727  ORF Transcript_24209/g.53727 Transcript_24209/m.53727 type:complete len:230 (+) Transcript_24209:760-1449(+)
MQRLAAGHRSSARLRCLLRHRLQQQQQLRRCFFPDPSVRIRRPWPASRSRHLRAPRHPLHPRGPMQKREASPRPIRHQDRASRRRSSRPQARRSRRSPRLFSQASRRSFSPPAQSPRQPRRAAQGLPQDQAAQGVQRPVVRLRLKGRRQVTLLRWRPGQRQALPLGASRRDRPLLMALLPHPGPERQPIPLHPSSGRPRPSAWSSQRPCRTGCRFHQHFQPQLLKPRSR